MRGWAILIALVAACGSDTRRELRMDFPRGSLYDAPFPADDLRNADGTVDLSLIEVPPGLPFMRDIVTLLDGQADGFGQTSAVFFASRVALDPAALPDVAASITPASTVFLLGIDPDAADYLVRYPIEVSYDEDGGPFGDEHLLTLLPVQGVPLLPATRYAAVVMRELGDASGQPLEQSAAVDDLANGQPAFDTLAAAAAALAEAGIALDDVAALTAYRTQDGEAGLRRFVAHARGADPPAPLTAPTRTDLFDEYCVYQTTVSMPVYQTGTPPFTMRGGTWPVAPAVDSREDARLVITIPRAAAPAAGYPTAVMVRTGGGGDRPLVDRGVRDDTGEPVVPGTGPALHFARAGFAGVTIDGPHGGLRNVTEGDEQLLIFNITNPGAIRDNIRQSALELALVPDILAGVTIDISDCPGATTGSALLDLSRLALMGHSMGATIAPLVLAVEPRYQAVILSGAGGSWIENVVHKRSPFEIRPVATSLLGYTNIGRELHERDPALSLFQWAIEAADPPLYARHVLGTGARHVLMFQGIVDTYILPPIANATSLSVGLDLAGDALDEEAPDLAGFEPASQMLPLVGRGVIALPASGNLPDGATGVVVQHLEDPIEDGHEVMFQLDAPKAQYQAFLASWLAGTPTVPATAASR